MNDVPNAFYESVFWVGCAVRGIVVSRLPMFITAQELSGNIGIVAQQVTSMFKYHVISIENNRIIRERRWYQNGEVPENLWIEEDKFVQQGVVHIYEGNEDSSEIADRICFPNAVYYILLWTTTVSKAWIDWACTGMRLTALEICKKLDDESIDLCKRLVETGRLTELHIGSDAFSEGAMEMAKLSLTQPLFKSLCFTEDGHLEDLLVFWSQNREALRGKDLYFGSPNAVDFLEGKLELCPQEEFGPIGRHHFYFPRTLFREPSLPYKLKYGGDDEDSRGAYVFFECLERNPNESELSYFARTPLIGILFT